MTDQISQIVTFSSYAEAVQKVLLDIIDPNLASGDGQVSYDWVVGNLNSGQVNQLIKLMAGGG
tara:strand:+ start:1008 stop:1196 length:189 start_codon:yes stop_codon:yes gene_type:complete